jgi:diguanylate cyclase (GGDEF)-like protein
MKSRLPAPGALNRFPGEFFVLGLAVCFAVQLVAGPAAALIVAGIVGALQLAILRRQRIERKRSEEELRLAQAEARKWQERANTFMHELACFRDAIDYQDPETGLGSTRQFEVEFIKHVARFRRRGEPFSVAVMQVRDPRRPDDPLAPPVIIASAHRLAETARVEDALCRVARRGFAVMLAGADARGAGIFVERARQRFSEGPVVVAGKRVELTISGGVAQYDPSMSDVQDILTAAARSLHSQPVPVDARRESPIRLAS